MMNATLETLLPGLDGPFRQTLPKMERMVQDAVNDPFMVVRSQAENIVLLSGETRPPRVLQLRCIFDWMVPRCGYVGDPMGWQLLKGPWQMLREIRERGRAMAACASHAMLAVSLGLTLRLRMGFVLCAPSEAPNDLQHVYAAMLDGDGTSANDLIACDTGNPSPVFGVHTDLLNAESTDRTFIPAFDDGEV
jgi:hypothetical protein